MSLEFFVTYVLDIYTALNFGLRLPSLPRLPAAGTKTRCAQTVCPLHPPATAPLGCVKRDLKDKFDDFVKSSTSALRCILRHCDVQKSTPHSSGFARLEFEAFYFVVRFATFYGIITIDRHERQYR